MKTIEIGRLGEDTATRFLKKSGYRILSRNSHQSHNELDIIAADSEYLVFAEVKTRTVDADLYSRYGTPASAVNHAKQTRLIRAAQQYLSCAPPSLRALQPRFDVIEIYIDKTSGKIANVHHITNAFGRS